MYYMLYKTCTLHARSLSTVKACSVYNPLHANKEASRELYWLRGSASYSFESCFYRVPHPITASQLLNHLAARTRLAGCCPVEEQRSQMGGGESSDFFYMKQIIRNACGTIGVLHAIGNNRDAAESCEHC